MSNAVNQDVFGKWAALHKQLGAAVGPPVQPEKITQVDAEIAAFAKANGIDPTKPVTQAGTPIPPTDTGYTKPVGWGASTDASTWVVSPMKDPPTQFKVVDNAGKNVATNFITQAGAQAFIDKAKAGGGTPTPPSPSPPSPPSPGGSGEVDQFGIKNIYKSKPGGRVVINPEVRPFTRHYASGKPDDPTVECTLDSKTPITNQECTAIITMKGMKHSDTIDWKMKGGHHSSDNGGKDGTCYDLEIMSDGSQSKYLEVERPHPSMHDCTKYTKPLFKLPDMSKARFGWKGICINTADGKGVHLEDWINLTPDDNNGWQKYLDITDTGQLPSGLIIQPIGSLATIRIDGIAATPTFEKVSMREITL